MSGEVRTGRCVWCGTYIEWQSTGPKDPPKLYCSKAHKWEARDESKRLQKIRKRLGGGACPTPDKRAYPSHTEAREATARQPLVQGVRPYECVCGNYHIGHVNRPGPKGSS